MRLPECEGDGLSESNGIRPLVLTPEQAAAQLQISERQIYRLIRTGELRSVKVGRKRRISMRALEDFVEHQERELEDAAR